jgi:signal transduction histidine kinase
MLMLHKIISAFKDRSAWWLGAVWLLSYLWVIWMQLQRFSTLRYNERDFLALIQNAIDKELAKAHALLNKCDEIIQTQPNQIFTTDFEASPYLFVFHDKRVLYWNTYDADPEALRPQRDADQYFYENELGKFIVLQRQVAAKDGRLLQAVVVLPLYRNYLLNNRYLTDKWLLEALQITDPVMNTKPGSYNVYGLKNQFLFSVSPDNFNYYKAESKQYLIGLSLLWLFFGLSVVIFYAAFFMAEQGNFGKGLMVLLPGIILPRITMLHQGWPADAFPFGFFNPMLYAYSVWLPSLGDLLINIILLFFLLFYLFRYYPLSSAFYIVYKLPGYLSAILLIIVSAGTFALTGFLYDLFKSLFFDTSRLLEPTDLFDIDLFPWYIIICIILLSLAYFFAIHILAFQALAWRAGKNTLQTVMVALGLGAGYMYWVWEAEYPEYLYLLHTAYFSVLLFSGLPRQIRKFKYRSYLYFFAGAFVVATICTYTIWNFRKWENGIYRQKISNLLIEEKDIIGEYLLTGAQQRIASDSLLYEIVSGYRLFTATREEYVKQNLIDKHFKQYEVEVFAFDAEGKQLIQYKSYPDLANYRRSLRNSMQPVRKDTLYFESNFSANVFKHYVLLTSIEQNGKLGGYIAIDLKWRGHNPLRVYEQLLTEQQVSLRYFPNLSFAFYQDTIPISTYGPFNFSKYKKIITEELKTRRNNEFNIENQTISPLYLKEGRILVIATPYFPPVAILANFSFIFLLLSSFIFLLIASYLLFKLWQRGTLSYAFKIQLYLNIAFFTPLVAVSVITISVLAQVNKNSNTEAAMQSAAHIKEKVLPLYQQLDDRMLKQKNSDRSLSYSFFKTDLDALAKSLDADFNIYDAKGQLYYSSRQVIFDKSLVSKYVNPEVIRRIVLSGQERDIITERIGNLTFKTAYLELKQNRAERLLGTLALPFFDTGKLINRNLNILITNILNIFTATFLIFLTLSYFASQIIIHPLRLITAQLGKTTLENNEPLSWNTNDEIGLMVQEYNRMLLNIEESKKNLAQTEKELAWREMAKQVAHEIKNPLTPMKLSLQLMRRKLQSSHYPEKDKLMASIETLLTQVDNLSEIATSFSMFAQMPQLENSPFDLVQMLESGCALFASHEQVSIQTNLPNEPIMVVADMGAMNRMLSNLLLNAIQSVPSDRQPIVEVGAETRDGYGRFWVRDNGSGIPDEVGEKVFLPNFSTKARGNGIGLALAKRGVIHASGRIWFETSVGKGTTFYVELPLV